MFFSFIRVILALEFLSCYSFLITPLLVTLFGNTRCIMLVKSSNMLFGITHRTKVSCSKIMKIGGSYYMQQQEVTFAHASDLLGSTILVPRATRLNLQPTSGSGRNGKYEFFHWLKAIECAKQIKNIIYSA